MAVTLPLAFEARIQQLRKDMRSLWRFELASPLQSRMLLIMRMA